MNTRQRKLGTGQVITLPRASSRGASLDALERRLDDGYARIEQAAGEGSDTSTWEDFWIDLLHEYETLHDELARAA